MTSSDVKSVDPAVELENPDQRSSLPFPMTRTLQTVNHMIGHGPLLQPRRYRASTEAFHRRAVERALSAIRQRFAEEDIGLSAIAAEAYSSPFHFSRVFRRVSGVPPCHFLSAVRMEAAKQLLADTALSVTNMCLEVGYSSLGTFTRRFTELVGLSPRAFRSLARCPAPLRKTAATALSGRAGNGGTITGQIAAPSRALVAVGLFPTPLPHGRPVACCIANGPGPYIINSAPEGRFFVLAVAIEANGRLSREPELRSAAATPIEISPDHLEEHADIQLRPPAVTDPPILAAVPFLLRTGTAQRARAATSGDRTKRRS
jgi:AraC family transcriptional regulator